MEESRKKEILELDEVSTFFLVNECGAFIWHMSHNMADGKIPEESHEAVTEDVNNVTELQKFAVDNLGRFNIDPESAKDRENGEYWKWYRFWDTWKDSLSDEDWNAVNQLLQNKESVEKYLPKNTWRD